MKTTEGDEVKSLRFLERPQAVRDGAMVAEPGADGPLIANQPR